MSLLYLNAFLFVKLYDTVQVQSNTDVYSSFVTIYINPVITSCLIKVGLGGVRMLKIALLRSLAIRWLVIGALLLFI